MSFVYNNIALIGKHYKKEVSETIEKLYKYLSSLGLNVIVETVSSEDVSIDNLVTMTIKDIAIKCDIAIVVGGDGSFLQATRLLALYGDIPVVGVNKGKLGFLTTISPDSTGLEEQLIPILKGESYISSLTMLKCDVDNDIDVNLEASTALNEIAITASRGYMFGVKVYIDGRYAFDQRGDGLIVSTPTGSTAHALSAGGPILDHDQNSIVIVPICSHSLNSRPLVISNESVIDIYITEYNNPESVLSIDGRHDTVLLPKQRVRVQKASRKARVLHHKDYNYYDTLRNKLGWSKVLF